MPASPLDSVLYGKLFGDSDLAPLFTDSAALRAMLVVEGALAKAQATLGMIPKEAAEAIHRDGMEVVIDPALLAQGVADNGIPVPGMVAEFRRIMAQEEHAQWVHFGATTQDIIDTSLMLRLRRALSIIAARGAGLVADLGTLAQTHAETPMAARTWGVAATPTSLGAVAAGWGTPLLRHLARLEQVRDDVLWVSLSGAAGTNAAMGPDGSEVRALLAKSLNLKDPGGTWHSARDGIAGLANWLATLGALCAKLAQDVNAMVRTGEARLAGGGSSSTMPQKQNPVLPAAITALCRSSSALAAALQASPVHADQRDGAAWMTEWLTLPQLVQSIGRAVSLSQTLVQRLELVPDAMAHALDDGSGLIYAEALSFHMARHIPRPQAQAAVKELCLEVRATGGNLQIAAQRRWPEQDFKQLFTPAEQLGDAPAEALAFAAAARAQAPKEAQDKAHD